MINALLLIIDSILLTFILGSLVGYLIHRLMHANIFVRLSHSHNVHHTLYTHSDFESDVYRDAGGDDSTWTFLPVILLVIGLMSLGLWFLFHAWYIYPIIVLIGSSIGYANIKLHEYFHIKNHYLAKYKWFQNLKELHILHHEYPETNLGILWFIPDKLFKTYRK